MVDDEKIILDSKYEESGGTLYFLNKNYEVVAGKRIFKKKKALYVSGYSAVGFGDGLYLDADGNKNYIVNFF